MPLLLPGKEKIPAQSAIAPVISCVLKRQRLAILGSTGSIGTQTLEVVTQHRDKFEVVLLTSHRNTSLLSQQAQQFQVADVLISEEAAYQEARHSFSAPAHVHPPSALYELLEQQDIDIYVVAWVGFSGLKPTLHALRQGRRVALANKETLVVAGDLVRKELQTHKGELLPIDSEHAAIFQCLMGEQSPVERLILTASGGALRNLSSEEIQHATPAMALKHPTWQMGQKVTIDSATLMNKGLEVIEAHQLFQVPAEKIDVVIHPPSVIHSMVEFQDGSVKAQMGLPDMRLPILFALSYPHRYPLKVPKWDLSTTPPLTFSKPDTNKYPCLMLAYEALKRKGNIPCVLNAANEIAVQAFLQENMGFLDIAHMVEYAISTAHYVAEPTYEDLVETDRTTRHIISEKVKYKMNA